MSMVCFDRVHSRNVAPSTLSHVARPKNSGLAKGSPMRWNSNTICLNLRRSSTGICRSLQEKNKCISTQRCTSTRAVVLDAHQCSFCASSANRRERCAGYIAEIHTPGHQEGAQVQLCVLTRPDEFHSAL